MAFDPAHLSSIQLCNFINVCGRDKMECADNMTNYSNSMTRSVL